MPTLNKKNAIPSTKAEFDEAFDRLTPIQRDICKKFLGGMAPIEIAQVMSYTENNVTKHMTKICQRFGLYREEGEYYADHRKKLVAVAAECRPEQVNFDAWGLPRSTPAVHSHPPSPSMAGTESWIPGIYIERPPYEGNCYQSITQPYNLTRIKASAQTGKSWLLEHSLERLRQQDYDTLTFSFDLFDRDSFRDLRSFTRQFCASISDESLGYTNRVSEFWSEDKDMSCCNNTTRYLEKYLLAEREKPLVLALDKVDRVFESEVIRDDVCSLLRGWNEITKRNNQRGQLWQKLRLVIVHSTEVYKDWNINHSPLAGVGTPINLDEDAADFTAEHLAQLAQGYGLTATPRELVPLQAFIGGQPLLAQQAIAYVQKTGKSLAHLLEVGATPEGPFINHLAKLLAMLDGHDPLKAALRDVVLARQPVVLASSLAFKLQSLGLIRFQGNHCYPRCELYRQFFTFHLS